MMGRHGGRRGSQLDRQEAAQPTSVQTRKQIMGIAGDTQGYIFIPSIKS